MRFDADEWCDLMVRAGLKFFTFTAKHHDGFCLYDTATRVRRRRDYSAGRAPRIVDCDLRYSIMDTPFRRDVLRELIAAGRRRGLGIGVYFSHIDWFDADFRADVYDKLKDRTYTRQTDPAGFARMIARHREQIRELCAHYGPIDVMSFDALFPDFPEELNVYPDVVETVKLARRLQPAMLMRHRGIGAYGDYFTPEGGADNPEEAWDGAFEIDWRRPAPIAKPWKVIYPGGKHMSHVWNDTYKPAAWIIENLVDVAAKGGNFQVGYGPCRRLVRSPDPAPAGGGRRLAPDPRRGHLRHPPLCRVRGRRQRALHAHPRRTHRVRLRQALARAALPRRIAGAPLRPRPPRLRHRPLRPHPHLHLPPGPAA